MKDCTLSPTLPFPCAYLFLCFINPDVAPKEAFALECVCAHLHSQQDYLWFVCNALRLTEGAPLQQRGIQPH